MQTKQNIHLLLNVLRIFWDTVDPLQLKDAETTHGLRMFYVHLNAYNLLLTEYVSAIHIASPADLEFLTRSVLNKFTSFPPSVMPDCETALPASNPFPRFTALKH